MEDTLVFNSREEVEALTFEQAMNVLASARECLIEQLISQRTHAHMSDDCGDYLIAATYNWSTLFTDYFDNDGDETYFIETVKQFLLTPPFDNGEGIAPHFPYGGSDGEIRFTIVPFMQEEEVN